MILPPRRLITGIGAGLSCVLLLFAAPPPAAAQTPGIAAIVNDEPVSNYDLDQRVRLILATSNLPFTPENAQRARAHALRLLLDETIQQQATDAVGIAVSDDEIEAALRQVAERNGTTPEIITLHLGNAGVDIETLRRQLAAGIAWNKFIRRYLARTVSISDGEVDRQLKSTLENAELPRFFVSEIFLPFDSAVEEQTVARDAAQIVDQLRTGAPFHAIASQLSRTPSAAAGGEIGWIQPGQLPRVLDQTIAAMEPGEISDPVRTPEGYYILLLRNRAQGTEPDPLRNNFALVRVTFPIEENADNLQLSWASRGVRTVMDSFTTCGGLPELVASVGGEIENLGRITALEASPELRPLLQEREAGEIVPPRRTPQGVEMYVVCDRKDDQGLVITRDDVEDSLFSRELSLIARRHLRDLKRDAIIERR